MANKSTMLGIILIGSTVIDLQIINRKSGKVIDQAHRNLILDSDFYAEGWVDDEQIHRMIEILNRFKQLLSDYGVTDYEVWGSNSLAAAHNSIYLTAQLRQATGFKIKWLNAGQEAYYGQTAMRYADEHFTEQGGVFLVSLSSGRLSLGYYQDGKLQFTRSISIGPLWVASQLDELADEVIDLAGLIREYIHSKLADYEHLLPPFEAGGIMLISGSLALDRVMPQAEMSKEEFLQLNQDLLDDPMQKWIDRYQFTLAQAEVVMPELLLIEKLTQMTAVDKLVVRQHHLLPGLVLEATGKLSDDEILVHAYELSRRFGVEPKHQEQVLRFAEQLFDRMKKLHGLRKRERLLLQIAALVHDVGTYLNASHHAENSEKIILADEIDGLTPSEIAMTAVISHYHADVIPRLVLNHDTGLDVDEQIIAVKLAAILRLADALDDSRLQKIDHIAVSMNDDPIVVTGYSHERLYLEQWTFNAKADLFQHVFGREIKLQRKGMK